MAKANDGEERDAIDLLMEDHKRVQKLFKDFEKIQRDDDEALRDFVEMTCMELQIHSLLEEELFYPAVRTQLHDASAEDVLNCAEVEHETADELIAKLRELDTDDPMYLAYFAVLTKYVRHHIREEEKELFPQVRKMSALDLRQLAEDMRRRRDELFAEIESEEEEDDAEAPSDAEDDTFETDVSDIAESVEELEDEEEALDPRKTRH